MCRAIQAAQRRTARRGRGPLPEVDRRGLAGDRAVAGAGRRERRRRHAALRERGLRSLLLSEAERCRLVFFRSWAHNTRCDARWNVATRRLRRTIGRWSSRQKSEAWRTWIDVVEDERRRIERERDSARRLRSTVGRWCERFLARAWRTWTEVVEYETLLAANEAASARRLRSALQHWRLRKTAKAWRAWTEAVEESARGDRRLALSARDLRLCVKRWVCRKGRAAFRTWRRFLDIQRRLERCLRRCLNRHLAMGLSKWTSHCHFTKRTRERHAVAFDMMERCIGRLLHRSKGERPSTRGSRRPRRCLRRTPSRSSRRTRSRNV